MKGPIGPPVLVTESKNLFGPIASAKDSASTLQLPVAENNPLLLGVDTLSRLGRLISVRFMPD